MIIADVFKGLDDWKKLVEILRDHKVNSLVIRTDNADIEIKGNTVYTPQRLESVFKELLQDVIISGRHHHE